MRKSPTYTPDQEFAVLGAYQEGLSLADCARCFGIPKQTIRYMLIRYGIPRRPKGGSARGGANRGRFVPLAPQSLLRTYWLYEQGLTMAQIAEAFGVHKNTISDRLRKNPYECRIYRSRNVRAAIPAYVQRTLRNWGLRIPGGSCGRIAALHPSTHQSRRSTQWIR